MSLVTMAGGMLALIAAGLTVRPLSVHFYLDMLGLPARVNYPLVATTLIVVLAIGGVLAAVTGLAGFCPACAMAGRKPLEGPP